MKKQKKEIFSYFYEQNFKVQKIEKNKECTYNSEEHRMRQNDKQQQIKK